MAHTETYELQYPFKHKGEEVTELTIRRPKMRDLKKFEGIQEIRGYQGQDEKELHHAL